MEKIGNSAENDSSKKILRAATPSTNKGTASEAKAMGTLVDDDADEKDEDSYLQMKKMAKEKMEMVNAEYKSLTPQKLYKLLCAAVEGAIDGMDGLLFSYGPPYIPLTREMELYAAIVREASLPEASPVKIHALLSQKIDPNNKDDEDMQMAPMHYAARYCHFVIMQMLFKAGANVNVTNEMGVRPLSFAVMFTQKAENRNLQLRVIRSLLNHGADVNWIDKSGRTAIDYSVYLQDMEVTEILLDAGANVLRASPDRKLVAPRIDLLSQAKNADLYCLINERLKGEQAVMDREREERNEKARKLKEERDRIKAHEADLNMRARNRMLREQAAAQSKAEAAREKGRKEIQEKLDREANKGKIIPNNGYWNKTKNGNWEWIKTRSAYNPFVGIADESRQKMKQLREETNIDRFEKRWNAFTKSDPSAEGGHIETRWTLGEAFKEDDDDVAISEAQSKEAHAVIRSPKGVEEILEEAYEQELEGVDLNDLMETLAF